MAKRKSQDELKLEALQAGDKKFLDELKEVLEPLNEKHGRRLIPIINRTQYGSFPVFAIERFDTIKVQPANEKREESETN